VSSDFERATVQVALSFHSGNARTKQVTSITIPVISVHSVSLWLEMREQ